MKIFVKTRALLLCTALVSAPALAQGSDQGSAQGSQDWSLTGYVKTYGVIQGEPDIDGAGDLLPDQIVQSQNALRLMLSGDLSDTASLEVHYEIKPQFSTALSSGDLTGLGATTTTASGAYRFRDLNNEISGSNGKRTLLQNLDRLNLRLSYDVGDITIGRQAIAFGSARFVSPTDIFKPFLVSTLDTEYRVGVDAIRFQKSFGVFAELDLGLVIGKDGDHEQSAVYSRFRTSLSGNDIEVTGIFRDNMTLLGGGIERALGQLGFWAEAAWTDNKYASDYVRASIGLDKAFSDNIFTMVEYHYSGAGADDAADYLGNLTSPGFSSGGVYLLGQHYLMPSISWTASPLLGLSASGFINLTDGSLFARLGSEFSLSDNLYTDFGLYLGVGDNAALTALPPFAELGSEFGSFAPTFYASLRYYF